MSKEKHEHSFNKLGGFKVIADNPKYTQDRQWAILYRQCSCKLRQAFDFVDRTTAPTILKRLQEQSK